MILQCGAVIMEFTQVNKNGGGSSLFARLDTCTNITKIISFMLATYVICIITHGIFYKNAIDKINI